MAETDQAGRWEQLNRCPECGREMARDLAVGERIGLFYTCPEHGRFRFSWDDNRLEPEEAPAAAASERSETSRSERGWGPANTKKRRRKKKAKR